MATPLAEYCRLRKRNEPIPEELRVRLREYQRQQYRVPEVHERRVESVRRRSKRLRSDPEQLEVLRQQRRESSRRRRADPVQGPRIREQTRASARRYYDKNKDEPDFIYRRYRSKAKHRRLAWSLTLEEFVPFLDGPCSYCGKQERCGVDRINNAFGYELGNVHSCCCVCNLMKHVMAEADFLNHIKNVFYFHACKQPAEGVRSERRLGAWNTFKSYEDHAKRRNLCFLLTEEQFCVFYHSPCFYCGAPPPGGIDRHDNTEGYTLGNSVPSCFLCNRMKLTHTADSFINQVVEIFMHRKLYLPDTPEPTEKTEQSPDCFCPSP